MPSSEDLIAHGACSSSCEMWGEDKRKRLLSIKRLECSEPIQGPSSRLCLWLPHRPRPLLSLSQLAIGSR
jgi:hypothetical protein